MNFYNAFENNYLALDIAKGIQDYGEEFYTQMVNDYMKM